MWWRTHCCFDIWRSIVFLGRRRLRTTRPSRYAMYAKGWRWLPLLTNAEDDSSVEELGCQRSLMWKGAYSCSTKDWPPLFLGSRSLWPIGPSRHLDFPSRRGRLSLPADTTVRQCPQAAQINSCKLRWCPHDGSYKSRWNLLLWRWILRITWIWQHLCDASRCWFLPFHACSKKDWWLIKPVRCSTSLWWFSFNGSHKGRHNFCMGRSHIRTAWTWRYKRSSQKYW